MSPRLALDSQSSCLSLLSAKITGVCHHFRQNSCLTTATQIFLLITLINVMINDLLSVYYRPNNGCDSVKAYVNIWVPSASQFQLVPFCTWLRMDLMSLGNPAVKNRWELWEEVSRDQRSWWSVMCSRWRQGHRQTLNILFPDGESLDHSSSYQQARSLHSRPRAQNPISLPHCTS